MAGRNTDKFNKAKELGSYGVSGATRRTLSIPKPPTPRLPQLPSNFKMPSLRPRPNLNWRLAGVIAAALAIMILCGALGAWLSSDDTPGTTVGQNNKIVTGESRLISRIAKQLGPSVVSVNVNITSSSDTGTGYYGYYSQPDLAAAGTGIILSKSGIILTNRHVVPTGTTSVSVILSDGTELKNVSVIGRTGDSDSLDVAFLRINDAKGHTLTPAALGDSDTVEVGDDVVAIGNALGEFQNSVTSGIISGFGRSVQAGGSSGSVDSVENLDDLFQTDAAINEGNSGGPLVNLNGQVIGINTAIAGDAQNIGFAIPIDNIRGMISHVLKTGKFARAYIGVRYVPLDKDTADSYGLSAHDGAYIAPSEGSSSSILDDSPAAKAGLHEKDIITAVNGKKVDQAHTLTSLLGAFEPGQTIKLSILRGGKTKHINVTLGTLPNTN